MTSVNKFLEMFQQFCFGVSITHKNGFECLSFLSWLNYLKFNYYFSPKKLSTAFSVLLASFSYLIKQK